LQLISNNVPKLDGQTKEIRLKDPKRNLKKEINQKGIQIQKEIYKVNNNIKYNSDER